MKYILIMLMFSQVLYAQHPEQPEREEVSDHRSRFVLFRLINVQDKIDYNLERNDDFDHLLKVSKKDDNPNLIKLSRKKAELIESEFSKIFFKIKYELQNDEKNCAIFYEAFLRNEKIEICKSEDKKIEMIKSFIESLN